VGTLIGEWYYFYIFGSLSTVIAQPVFSQNKSYCPLLLSTFRHICVGVLIVRPFGALVFVKTGRSHLPGNTFSFYARFMGSSTFAIGPCARVSNYRFCRAEFVY